MVFSASVTKSYAESGGQSTTTYLYHQLTSLIIGVCFWIAAYKIDYPVWRRLAPKLFYLSIFILIMVLFMGRTAGGAQRWLDLGVRTFQPTELIKITFILFMAFWFEQRLSQINSSNVAIPFVSIIAFLGILILEQPNLSTTIIISAIGMSMFFVAGARLTTIFSLFGAGALAVAFLIKNESYRFQRMMVFLNPGADKTDMGYQINQALIAIGSGGLLGLGFSESRQKLYYLPEVTTDAIFPIIAEELGFIRAILIILVYLFIVVQGFKIAKKAPDEFSRLIAVGISTWFMVQVFVNIGAMLSILPLTGVPLIFISFGGSSLVFSLTAVGILLNISKYTKEEVLSENSGRRWGNGGSYLPGFSSNRRARKKRI